MIRLEFWKDHSNYSVEEKSLEDNKKHGRQANKQLQSSSQVKMLS